jgi:hypothetical protein
VPVADLRIEIYPQQQMQDFGRIERVQPGWDALLSRFGAEHALLRSDSALADALVKAKGWDRLAASGEFVLLRSPAGRS